MAGLILQTHEIYNFTDLPYPLDVGVQPLSKLESYDRFDHPHAGLLEYHNISFPHINVCEMHWKTRYAMKLVNQIPSDSINFIFQLDGFNDVHYGPAGQHVQAAKGQHYMVFQPEGEFYNQVAPDSRADVLAISVNKALFASSIGTESRWAEKLQNSLALGRAFLSTKKAVVSTPRMQQLINGIIADKTPGPLRNFMMQSRALELVAAHLDQIATAEQQNNTISIADTEKLHRVKSHLDKTFLEDHSLDQLSRDFILNEFKLKRGFKLLFGLPVFAYIKSLRMDYATLLLKEKKSSVDEVAFLLGYEYPQHFSTAYKKHTGINPSLIKK